MAVFGLAEMQELLGKVFAPWVQDLAIQPVVVTENCVRFRLPENPRLVRTGGDGPPVICGQSVAAVADTASVLALCAFNSRFRNCTTADMTTHFMRPMMLGDVDVAIEALSNGRRMAVTRAEFRSSGSPKLAATAICSFAYLEE